MRILFICGSYSPEKCGIGDYLSNLVRALKEYPNIEILLMVNKDWSIKNYFSILKEIKESKPDIIHIQYPSNGYGLSLLPQLISLRLRAIITLHEVSHSKILRRLSLLFYSIRSSIIFTTSSEKKVYKKYYPWFSGKTAIIPIGANIRNEIKRKDAIKSPNVYNKIINFGQIRPKKGLEEVIELAALIRKNNLNYKVIIAGQLIERFVPYYNSLKNLDGADNITWMFDLKENEIGNLMQDASIAYFPFPDGASERRGSLLTALHNQMLVYTTMGKQTPNEMKDIVTIVNSPSDFILDLKEYDSQRIESLIQERYFKVEKYLAQRTWESIANTHLTFYAKFLKKKR